MVRTGVNEASDASLTSGFVRVPCANHIRAQVFVEVVGVVVGFGVHVDHDVLAGKGLGDRVHIVKVQLNESWVVIRASGGACEGESIVQILH